jgi:hypothetical protein
VVNSVSLISVLLSLRGLYNKRILCDSWPTSCEPRMVSNGVQLF